MGVLALVGAVTLLLDEKTLERIVLPLVAFSAGSLLGGAFFHMIPAAVGAMDTVVDVSIWVMAGYVTFFALEQFLHWHHCRRAEAECRKPLTILILLGDGLHNFIGGLAVAGAFLTDIQLGVTAWLAAAAHEIPQELGDFGVLVHGGWRPRRALAFNVLSGATFLVGGLVAYGASFRADISFLVPYAAGNFIYIASSDLVPEVNRHEGPRRNVLHLVAFAGGVLLLFGLRELIG